MQRSGLFDFFLTGAIFFLAGASFTAAMVSGNGWQRSDTQLAVMSLVMIILGCIKLRAIYRRQRAVVDPGTGLDPRPNDR